MVAEASAKPLTFRIGMGFVIISLICPLIALLIPLLGLSKSTTATLVGALLIGLPEVFIAIGAALAGKEAAHAVIGKVRALFRRKGPPKPVGRGRYNLGLILLVGSLVIGWVSVYVETGFGLGMSRETKVIAALALDVIMFAGFFILGGEFWEKFKTLFCWDIPAPSADRQQGDSSAVVT